MKVYESNYKCDEFFEPEVQCWRSSTVTKCNLYYDEFEETRKPNEHVHICCLDEEHSCSHKCHCGELWGDYTT